MKQHGGKRENAGRSSKATELKLVEKLSPLEPFVFKELEKGVKAGEFNFIKLYFEYMYGKPQANLDITSDNEKVTFNVNIIK